MAKKPKFEKKGRLNKNLQPRRCSGCPAAIPLHSRVLHLDVREYNESGVLPLIEDKNNHYIYLFCSVKCLLEFSERVQEKGGLDLH